jgi:hypothetical protein
MGIKPTSEAWEARNKILKAIDLAALSFQTDSLKETRWKLKAVAVCRVVVSSFFTQAQVPATISCPSGSRRVE